MDLLEIHEDELDYESYETLDNYGKENNKAVADDDDDFDDHMDLCQDGISESNLPPQTSTSAALRKRHRHLDSDHESENDFQEDVTTLHDDDTALHGENSSEGNLPRNLGTSSLARTGRIQRISLGRISEPTREEFGLASDDDSKKKTVSEKDLQALYNQFKISSDDENYRFNTAYVRFVSEMPPSSFDISRIFAEFNPSVVRFVDERSCFVRFDSKERCAQMLLEMSRPVQRVRKTRRPEDGELMSDDDEEEGQVKEVKGEDVAVVGEKHMKGRKILRINDIVEVDSEEISIPRGRWRALVKHVSEDKLVLIRFARGFDVRRGVMYNPPIHLEEESHDPEPEYIWSSRRDGQMKAGLNIFDEHGNELDWDYEHDTRFFDQPEEQAEEKGSTSLRPPQEAVQVNTAMGVVKSRGRGTKKFIQALTFDEQHTLASDSVEK